MTDIGCPAGSTTESLLEVVGLKVYFPITGGFTLARRPKQWVKAVDEINFKIAPGEIFGLVGESGCGKTTTSKVILRLQKPTQGAVLCQGDDISSLKGESLKKYRSYVQPIFQDPTSSLNPRMKVDNIIAEPMKVNSNLSAKEIRERVELLMLQVGLRKEAASLYPHEFSGGQRQRIAMARALSLNVKLIVLDEPVSALDVSIRSQIIDLLKDLHAQLNIAYLLIAHDLALVRYMSNRVAVMYLGRILEIAAKKDLFSNALHPYTRALLSSALPSRPGIRREEIILSGEPPNPANIPSGCRFHPRCFECLPVCSTEEPVLKWITDTHMVACHRY